MPEGGMDIQARVAARRSELAKAAEEAARLEREEVERRQQEVQERKRNRVDALAADLTAEGTPIERREDVLAIAEPSPLEHLDPQDFRREQLNALFRREARRRWTPFENWLFIGPVAAGIALLLPLPLGSLLLWAGGYYFWSEATKRHRAALKAEFPQLFADVPVAEQSSADESSGGFMDRLVRRELDSFRTFFGPQKP